MDLKEFAKLAVSPSNLMGMVERGLKGRIAKMPNKSVAQRTLGQLSRMKPKIQARVPKDIGVPFEKRMRATGGKRQMLSAAGK